MGHLINAKEEVYHLLAERLNKNPIGAPMNELLMKILHRLYTESEALVGSKFPLLPMKFDQVAGFIDINKEELQDILEGMATKGLVIDFPRKDGVYYALAPMVVGFFEYTFMRVREDLDMKELAELFSQYHFSGGVVEEIFGGDTSLLRTMVYENLIPAAVETEVCDYEKATEVIRKAGGGALSMCSCRHKASHLGKNCDAPIDVCMSLGRFGEWVVKRGMGKSATVDELLQVLELTEKHGLVHNCDNVLNNPVFMCHCCSCCCGFMESINKFGIKSLQPSNFIAEVNAELCSECGACTEQCPISAINMVSAEDGSEVPVVKKELCIGCGLCANACPTEALTMSRRSALYVPPTNKQEHFMRIAKERGKI